MVGREAYADSLLNCLAEKLRKFESFTIRIDELKLCDINIYKVGI
jgi:hypothetical protein